MNGRFFQILWSSQNLLTLKKQSIEKKFKIGLAPFWFKSNDWDFQQPIIEGLYPSVSTLCTLNQGRRKRESGGPRGLGGVHILVDLKTLFKSGGSLIVPTTLLLVPLKFLHLPMALWLTPFPNRLMTTFLSISHRCISLYTYVFGISYLLHIFFIHCC